MSQLWIITIIVVCVLFLCWASFPIMAVCFKTRSRWRGYERLKLRFYKKKKHVTTRKISTLIDYAFGHWPEIGSFSLLFNNQNFLNFFAEEKYTSLTGICQIMRLHENRFLFKPSRLYLMLVSSLYLHQEQV